MCQQISMHGGLDMMLQLVRPTFAVETMLPPLMHVPVLCYVGGHAAHAARALLHHYHITTPLCCFPHPQAVCR
jgi:hypothetical protein